MDTLLTWWAQQTAIEQIFNGIGLVGLAVLFILTLSSFIGFEFNLDLDFGGDHLFSAKTLAALLVGVGLIGGRARPWPISQPKLLRRPRSLSKPAGSRWFWKSEAKLHN